VTIRAYPPDHRAYLPGRAGPCLIVLATVGLAIAGLMLEDGAGTLRPLWIPAQSFTLMLIFAAASSLSGLYSPWRRYWWVGPSVLWSILLIAGFANALTNPSMLSYVAPVQASLIIAALVVAALAVPVDRSETLPRSPLRFVATLALVLFGVVHLWERELVASLIPVWMPVPHMWPYVTGPLMIGAGAALWVPRWRAASALLVAGIFLSWVPLVHLERLIRAPDSLFEWRFALTAVALAGSLVVLAARTVAIRQDLPVALASPALP
jgi:uncharacterized membrane protein